MSGVTKVKFEMKNNVFRTMVEAASFVLPKYGSLMDIVENFHIKADNGGVHVYATDLELSMVVSTQAVKVIKGGTAIAPGRKLMELVQASDSADVKFELTDGLVKIQIGKAAWTFQSFDVTKFPELPPEAAHQDVDRDALIDALAVTTVAAGTSGGLSSIHFEHGAAVASDNTRVHYASYGLPLEMDLPAIAVTPLLRMLANSESQLSFGVGKHHLEFRVGPTLLVVAKAVDAFPSSVTSALQKAMETKTEVWSTDQEALVEALKLAKIASSTGANVTIEFNKKDAATIRMQDGFGNRSVVELEALECPETAEPVIVNYHYFLDLIKSIGDGTTVDMHVPVKGSTPLLALRAGGEVRGMLAQIGLA